MTLMHYRFNAAVTCNRNLSQLDTDLYIWKAVVVCSICGSTKQVAEKGGLQFRRPR